MDMKLKYNCLIGMMALSSACGTTQTPKQVSVDLQKEKLPEVKLICRTQPTIGSRIAKKECHKQAAWEKLDRNAVEKAGAAVRTAGNKEPINN